MCDSSGPRVYDAIGVFSSNEKAESAIQALCKRDGWSRGEFLVQKFDVDERMTD